jgi:hypothetical protein
MQCLTADRRNTTFTRKQCSAYVQFTEHDPCITKLISRVTDRLFRTPSLIVSQFKACLLGNTVSHLCGSLSAYQSAALQLRGTSVSDCGLGGLGSNPDRYYLLELLQTGCEPGALSLAVESLTETAHRGQELAPLKHSSPCRDT